MPAVSIARNVRLSSSKCTSTESRVVPGLSETIIRSARARVLINVDLPVLARPTTAIFISVSAGFSASADGSISSINSNNCFLFRFW